MDTNQIESLELFNQLAEHLAVEGAELAEQLVGEGKDSKRLYRGKIRHVIAKRDGQTCFYCKEKIVGRFHIDHLIPHTLGGRTVEENGVFTCPPCNLKKGARVW